MLHMPHYLNRAQRDVTENSYLTLFASLFQMLVVVSETTRQSLDEKTAYIHTQLTR